MREKIKLWAELIESEKLEDVLEDIQMNIRVRPDSQLNKYIFKLLLYLSHTADKCNKQNYMTGKKIAELAKLLCSLLVEVPDDKSYVISLYHIIRCLISFNLYEDIADICCYLEPRNLYNPGDDAMELMVKILLLWRIPINDIYRTLTSESLNTTSYNRLKSIIKNEIQMVHIAYKDYTKCLIVKISTHLDKIIAINKEKNIYFDDFCKYIQEHLAETQLYLNKDEKYTIYYHILHIISRTVCKAINTIHIEDARNTLDELSNCFKDLLTKDEECCQCFQQFQNLCVIFLKPIEKFTNESVKDMQNFISYNFEIAQKFGYLGCLKWNAYGIVEIAELIFVYWETSIKDYTELLLDGDILLEIMNLIVHMCIFFIKDISSKSKICLNEECTIKKDIYNVVAIKCRCVNLVTRFPMKILPKKVCTLARKILEQNVASIHEMKKSKCKCWAQLWTICGTLIYNMGIVSEHIYEESTRLFSLLCTCISRFEGIESDSKYLSFENPISSSLHRLSIIHYNNGMYREAMTASALNALLSYNQPNTKAFRVWANIKKKCASEEIVKLTILECLRNDKDKINDIDILIDISKYDLITLCSCEARCLMKERIAFTSVLPVLQELKKLKPNNRQYAHVIQLLGYYLLDIEYESSVLKYLQQAIYDLKQDKSNSTTILYLEAILQFFMFVEELCDMNKQTRREMENTKFALFASKLPEIQETKSPNVVPSYTMINIKKDSNLKQSLQQALEKWQQVLQYNINKIIKDWETNLILCLLITAGEYSRLYRYEDCEAKAWNLAYQLASKIEDYRIIMYVTGRSISLRQINYDWIAAAEEYAMKHRDSKDGNLTRIIAILWISLADLYFECGKYNDARKLLTEARNLSEISFLSNTAVYLLSLDTIIRNCNLYKVNLTYEDYGSYIVESLYAMVTVTQDLSNKKWKSQAEHLLNYDVLFTATVNLAVRVNSILSFREICAHLVRRISVAQSLGAVMRTAELLKSLCYIDLSRSKLDDCEVKLQGLEHILDLEMFQLSMDSKPEMFAHHAVSPIRIIDPVRDVPQHDASPILGKKIFNLPKFIRHTNCDCYKCCNASYQYLVFATTYIRAQLYALQNDVRVACDHFYGAFKIREKLFKEEESVLPGNLSRNEIGIKRFCWQTRSYITDYVQLLIDFCYFLKINVPTKQQDMLDIVNLAVNMCHKYNLEGHPLYVSAKELMLDNAFQQLLQSLDCLDFMVPQSYDIDISSYTKVPTDQSICITPSIQDRQAKKPLSVRRKKNPIILNLDEVDMIMSDDEDNGILLSRTTKKPKSRAKLIRRILEEDLSDDANLSTEDLTSAQIKLGNNQTENTKKHMKFGKRREKSELK